MARKSGSIIPRGEKRWLVRWYDGERGAGKRHYVSKTIKGAKADAQKYLNGVLRSRDVGVYAAPSKMTLDGFLDAYLEQARGRLAPATLTSYSALLDRHVRPELGQRRLDSIRFMDVQTLLNRMGEREKYHTPRRRVPRSEAAAEASKPGERLSVPTLLVVRAILSGVFKRAVRAGLIAASPVQHVEMPKLERREMDALSPEQIAAFREGAKSDRFATLFDFLVSSGCRPSEALALPWSSLDLAGGRAVIGRALTTSGEGKLAFKSTKTGQVRSILLPPSLVRALVEHRRAQAAQAMKLGPDYARDLDLVFADELGLPLRVRTVLQHFRGVLRRAGLPPRLRLYSLRHSCATALLAGRVPLKIVSERLGHASIAITGDVYQHVTETMQEQANAAIERAVFGSA